MLEELADVRRWAEAVYGIHGKEGGEVAAHTLAVVTLDLLAHLENPLRNAIMARTGRDEARAELAECNEELSRAKRRECTALCDDIEQERDQLAVALEETRAELAALAPGWESPAVLQEAHNASLASEEDKERRLDRIAYLTTASTYLPPAVIEEIRALASWRPVRTEADDKAFDRVLDDLDAEIAGEPTDDAATILQGALGGRWKIGQQLGTFGGNTPCDAPGGGGSYLSPDGSVSCRCVVCSRCGKHTGNSNQGHYWAFCKVTKSLREFHSCCPGDCELEPTGAGELAREFPPPTQSSVDGPRVDRIEFVPATAANILDAIMQNEAAWDRAHYPNANCSKPERHAPHVWAHPEHWCDGEPNSHPSPTISHVREFDGEVAS